MAELRLNSDMTRLATQYRVRFDSAIPGQHLNALISIRYIFIFRKDKIVFFNSLRQNHSAYGTKKGLSH